MTETAERGDVVLEVIPFGEYRELPTAAPADTIVIRASIYYPDRDGEIGLDGYPLCWTRGRGS